MRGRSFECVSWLPGLVIVSVVIVVAIGVSIRVLVAVGVTVIVSIVIVAAVRVIVAVPVIIGIVVPVMVLVGVAIATGVSIIVTVIIVVWVAIAAVAEQFDLHGDPSAIRRLMDLHFHVLPHADITVDFRLTVDFDRLTVDDPGLGVNRLHYACFFDLGRRGG